MTKSPTKKNGNKPTRHEDQSITITCPEDLFDLGLTGTDRKGNKKIDVNQVAHLVADQLLEGKRIMENPSKPKNVVELIVDNTGDDG